MVQNKVQTIFHISTSFVTHVILPTNLPLLFCVHRSGKVSDNQCHDQFSRLQLGMLIFAYCFHRVLSNMTVSSMKNMDHCAGKYIQSSSSMECNLYHNSHAQPSFTTCLLFIHSMSNMYAQYSVTSSYAQLSFTTCLLFIHSMSNMCAQYSVTSSQHIISNSAICHCCTCESNNHINFDGGLSAQDVIAI